MDQNISLPLEPINDNTQAKNIIIDFFPIYYKIFEEYFKGKNVTEQLNSIYKPIFQNVLMPNYTDLMCGIKEISDEIVSKYGKPTPYSIIDYLEFLFGNIFYETFYHQLKKIPEESVMKYHLVVFKYIIYVESVKNLLYNEIIQIISSDPESKYIMVMNKRKKNTELKINFCLKIIKFYDEKNLQIECEEFILDNGIQINPELVKDFDSFIKLGY